MFGYIKPFKPDMRISEYETYKGIYCTLCKSLGKNYGITSRLALSYDCTFVALIYLSLNDEYVCFKSKRCVVNPLKKCNYCDYNLNSFKFAGAVCVILTYYKINDDIKDSKFFKRLFFKILNCIFSFSYQKAKKKYKEIDKIVSKMMIEQNKIEKEKSRSIDKSAHPTASLLSSLFMMLSKDEKIKMVLKDFGYFMGRWIYLIDAADDIEKDLKEKNFNPFIKTNDINNICLNKYCNQVLNQSLSMAISEYSLLPVSRLKGIIDNIINLGLPNMQKYILFDKKEGKNYDRSL